jgi:hypothetical protein
VWGAPASGLIRTRATLAAWINPYSGSCREPQNRSDPTRHRVAGALREFRTDKTTAPKAAIVPREIVPRLCPVDSRQCLSFAPFLNEMSQSSGP